ncbi:MAG: hypothetical protein RIS09_110, partial [Actinomycetota bacterium]
MGIEAPAKDLSPRLEGQALENIALPNGREEEWRFTPLKRLRGLQNLSEKISSAGFEVESLGAFQQSTVSNEDAYAATDRLVAAAALLPDSVETFVLAKETIAIEPLKINFKQSQDVAAVRMKFGFES